MERSFQSIVSSFLTEHLPRARGAADNTVRSYRDAVVLLLRWLEGEAGIAPERVSFRDLGGGRVLAFLDHVEARGSVASRNNRLAALKSLARYAQRVEPSCLGACAEIIAIPAKRAPGPLVGHLTLEGVGALLGAAAGSPRDLAMLSLLYDLGARVQELCDLRVGDVRLERPYSAVLRGKGGKARVTPVTPQVARIVAAHLAAAGATSPGDPLFRGRTGGAIGRAGVAYVLGKRAGEARAAAPGALPGRVTPHMLRHSKAMHLLEAGVNLIYIRDFLGHASVTTTEIYAKASPELKRKAIEDAAALTVRESAYGPEEREGLLKWLRTIV